MTRATGGPPRPNGWSYCVYVVQLDDAARPAHVTDGVCIYVGQTSHTPEERLAKHRAGIRSAKSVRKYGLHLRPDLVDVGPFATRAEALAAEADLAKSLRDQGFHVFGGH